jgi:hypothetical protein
LSPECGPPSSRPTDKVCTVVLSHVTTPSRCLRGAW